MGLFSKKPQLAESMKPRFGMLRNDHTFQSTNGGTLSIVGYAPWANGTLIPWDEVRQVHKVAVFNTAGTSYQPAAQGVRLDEELLAPVHLVADFTNKHDRNAVRVETPRGVMLGYVPKPINVDVAQVLKTVKESRIGALAFQVTRDASFKLVYVAVMVPLAAMGMEVEVAEDEDDFDDPDYA